MDSAKGRFIIGEFTLERINLLDSLLGYIIIFIGDGIDGEDGVGHGFVGFILDGGLLGADLLDALEVNFLEVGTSHW